MSLRPPSALTILTLLAHSVLTSSAAAQFVDVTNTSGSDLPAAGSARWGVAWGDVDGDGDQDIFLPVRDVDRENALYRNDGGDVFRDIASGFVATPRGDNVDGSLVDTDQDGHLDLFIAGDFRTPSVTRLGLNQGNGVFQDAGLGAIVNDDIFMATWADRDLDGDLDACVVGATSNETAFLDNTGTTFVRVPLPPPFAPATTLAATWGDPDRDGDPDLFFTTRSGPLLYYRRDGGSYTIFEGPDIGMGVTDPSGFGADWGDFDLDGDDDLLLSARLWRNDSDSQRGGGPRFSDATPTAHANQCCQSGIAWADLDNDGDEDYVVGSGDGCSITMRNDGGGSFASVNLGIVCEEIRAIAWADHDGDGDLDCLLTNGGEVKLYRNDLSNGNRWLQVKLQGTTSNRDAIGARVTVTTENGGRVQTRLIKGGAGYLSQGQLAAHFGLASATVVEELRVDWPGGGTGVFRNVAVDQCLEIVQGSGFSSPVSGAPASAAPGSMVTFAIGIDPPVPASVTLWTRRGGLGIPVFDERPMVFNAGTWTQFVPGDEITDRGLDYWFEIRGGGCDRLDPPTAGFAPNHLPAELTGIQRAQSPAAEQHVLIGLPLAPADPSPDAVLGPILGPYDPTKWRLGRWSDAQQGYLEPPDPAMAMNPGKGFWLVQRNPVPITVSGRSSNTATGVPVQLTSGWNMISQPFLFTTGWSQVDLTGAPGVGPLLGYNAGTYSPRTNLVPWEGYFVFNGGSPVQIVLPGVDAPDPSPAPAYPAAGEWSLDVEVAHGTLRDAYNVAGVRNEASGGFGAEDLPEPPAIPQHVRAWFEPAGEGFPLMWDYRPADSRGLTWDLVVDVPAADESARLTIDGASAIPAGWAASLFVEETLAEIDLGERSELPLAAGAEHRFRLVVGPPEWIASERSRAPAGEGPVLAAPFPNPFRESATIAFSLPAESNVRVAVYDVTGRLVRTLLSESAAAGRHVHVWDGTDARGRTSAPGVYFVRLESPERTLSRRLTVLR